MLEREEIIDLLSYIQAYDDRRDLNPATVASWQEASVRGRWTFDDAVDAVHQHHANSTVRIMPGHITEALRIKRAQPVALPEQRRREIDRPAAASPQTVRDCMEQVARKLGWDQELDRRSTLAEPCEHCHAGAGEQCTRPARRGGQETRVPLQRPHPGRVEAAESRLMDQEARR